MKTALITFLILISPSLLTAQAKSDEDLVRQACLNYIEGFYQGDTTKIIASVSPTLHKFGYWKDKDTKKYALSGHMSFEEAKAYAARVARNKKFAKADAPKEVTVLDVMNHIAAARITAWWGSDYLLLARSENGWRIESVVWEGPLETKR